MNKFYTLILLTVFPVLVYSQWYQSNIDTSGMIYTASFLNKDTFIISTNVGLFRTFNNGQKFHSINGYEGGPLAYLKFKSYDTIYAAPYSLKGMLKSYDAGKTWSSQTLLMPNGDTAFQNKYVIYFDFFDNANGIILGDRLNGKAQVFLTHNGGQTWEFYSHPSIDQIYTLDLSRVAYTSLNHYIFQNGTAKILLGTQRELVTFSEYGRIWSRDYLIASRIAFKDSLNGLAKTTVQGGLAKTTDGGNTWIEVPGDHGKQIRGDMSFVRGTAKFPGFYLAGIEESYASYDDGATWQLFDTINHGSGTVFFRDAETGVCSLLGAGAPIYYYNPLSVGLKETTLVEKRKTICYPNPANNEITFYIPWESVQLFDIQGKLLKDALNTNRLEISEIPNGLYWLKAVDDNQQTATQKVLIQH